MIEDVLLTYGYAHDEPFVFSAMLLAVVLAAMLLTVMFTPIIVTAMLTAMLLTAKPSAYSSYI